ncbi:MAG: amidase [Rhodospirillaceae bacterium]|nr:amidase [Rhodospirillaceae bacterium]
MSEIHYKTATELMALLEARELGARELLEHFLDRVERHNPAINAIVWQDAGRARAEADAADRRRAAGEETGPLDGLPVTVKESYDLAGSPTTWGVPDYRDNIAETDAAAVERYRGAGAVVFGKTNVPFMLADWQSFNAIYGTCNNPWDLGRTPGGSSGGSAAALAAGLTGLDAGSDIGASIRNPAHYCGVFGHKPTWEIVSARGQALPGDRAPTDIAVVGPLARSAADLKLAFGLLAGADGPAARGWWLELPAPRRRTLRDYRVGVLLSDPQAEVEQSYQDAIAALARWLESEGATVEIDAKPGFSTAEAMEVYTLLLRAETSKHMTDEMMAQAREDLDRLPADAIPYRRRMLEAQTMLHRDWLRWNERRYALMAGWEAWFETYDLLLCPAAASPAFPHDQAGERHDRTIAVNGRVQPVVDQLFWAGYPCGYYLPSTVAPIGLADGLPVGIQIVGRQYDDLTCLHMAGLIEEGYRRFAPPPGY